LAVCLEDYSTGIFFWQVGSKCGSGFFINSLKIFRNVSLTFTFFGVKFSFNVMKVEGGNGNESAACKYYCADLQRGKIH